MSQEVGEDLVSYLLERLNFRSLDGLETLGGYDTNVHPGSTDFFQVYHGNFNRQQRKNAPTRRSKAWYSDTGDVQHPLFQVCESLERKSGSFWIVLDGSGWFRMVLFHVQL